MIVGMDVRKINDTGIGRYIRGLLRAMVEVDVEDRFVLFGDPRDARVLDLPGERARWVANRSGKYSLMEQVSLPWQAEREGIDLFHAPHYTLPLFLPCRSVVTIHDLIHLRFPKDLPTRAHPLYARWMARSAARRARIVITVSRHSRGDIVSLLGIPAEKVRVIPNGVEEDFFREDRADRKPGEYILVVSSNKPHKNLEGAVRAYGLIADRVGQRLRVVGDPPERGSALDELIRRKGLANRVEFLGRLEEEELRRTYRGASVLLSLSRYEGFGLPVIEAMASGVPVVLSRASSHPEVAGDAAVMVEPSDFAGAAESVVRLISDPCLRDRLVARGRERARHFSWKEAAIETLACYREAYEGRPRS